MGSLSDFQTILVGCGKMGSALIGGAVRMGVIQPRSLSCVDVDANRAEEFARSLNASTDVPAGEKRLFVMAVKPNQMESALAEYTYASGDVILSVAAGVTSADLRNWAGDEPRVVRSMPNTPSLVGAGVTGVYFPGDRVGAALRNLGPGLGDVALRVCCFLEGLETAEKRMGWSARSGKVVLRIALQRLKRHYDDLGESDLIG